MASDRRASSACPYCGEFDLRLARAGLYHRRKKNHGPFDYFECGACGSCVTDPMPSAEAQSALYQEYDAGLPREQRDLMNVAVGEAWHELCLQRIAEVAGVSADATFSWIDAGAGSGEMANLMLARFPNSRGIAVDLHDRPAALDARVEWRRMDLDSADFARRAGGRADVVYATAVWEHVREPGRFIDNMLSVLDRPGVMYLLCPNYASLARRIMGRKWPYLSPGEHLTIPTPDGARRCIARAAARREGGGAIDTESGGIWLPYSLAYAAARFGFARVSKLIPKHWELPLPVGALETIAFAHAAGTRTPP
jgi:SAM-dependent methyltransferase